MNVQILLKKHLIIAVCVFSCIAFCTAQETILYKKIDSSELNLEIYYPANFDSLRTYPAMVFFFGGGWNGGSTTQFEKHAEYFSQRGITCFLADYRTRKSHGTTPFESLKDAKSAIRFIRKNADKLGVDSSKIIASGGSAGGHLAAAAALVKDYNEESDDLSISCIPNALVLFNPVIDNGPGGYGYERIGEEFKSFSPLHNIRKSAPPTILFLGTNDRLIPVETANYYTKVMNKVGSRSELFLYEGQDHGFFNYKNFEYYKKTVSETDAFLQSLGYLQSKPIVTID